MAKFCPNCGTENTDVAVSCSNCGVQFVQASPQAPVAPAAPAQAAYTGTPLIAERNMVLAIVLALVTCGIYSIYWFIVMTDEANKVSGEQDTSGVMAFLFTLLTCGIYGFFWYYKMGKKLHAAGQRAGKEISDNSILYLVLGLFGLGIVNYALIQNDLNKFAK